MSYTSSTKIVDENGVIMTPTKELTQVDLDEMLEIINEALSQLKFLSSVRGIAADLRVTLLSGVVTTVSTVTTVTTVATVTTVTTVATVTNIAQIGGVPANQLVPSQQNLIAEMGNTVNTTGF